MKFVAYIFLFSLLALSGCATPPKSAKTYDQVQIGSTETDRPVLVIYRDLVPPVMYSVTVQIAGKPVAKLPNKAFTWVYLNQGSNDVKVSWPILAATPSKRFTVTAVPGRTYYYEFGGHTEMSGVGVSYNLQDISAQDEHISASRIRACCGYVPSGF